MGYIAPIHQLTYQNYRQRLMKEKRKAFSVNRVYPVHHHLQYEQTKDEASFSINKNLHYSTDKLIDSEGSHMIHANHILADEQTKKGQLFDVKI